MNMPQAQTQTKTVVPFSKKIAGIISAESVKKQFESVLKEQAGSFLASIIELSNDKFISQCEPSAVVSECLKAATLKLPINKQLGLAYVVAYKNVPTMIIGYKGLIQLAMRSGQYRCINAGLIYEGQITEEDYISGEFKLKPPDYSKPVVGFFAYEETINGFKKMIRMTTEQVNNHAKRYSKCYNPNDKNNVWVKNYDEMGMKTLLRILLGHYGILSIELVNALSNDSDYTENDLQIEKEPKREIDMTTAEDTQEPVLVPEPEQTGNLEPEF